ncbi:hypothetical protein [Zobellia nedashkovskayae]|uniref:hypothetical protein n=1 Tax=Zobellia nedashkovskayae TaxID=2779510 RepID=UPI00188B244F|nr:hypothetical protein [Zobellia nedashkovskayae]
MSMRMKVNLSDYKKIIKFPKYDLGNWPTPIYKIDNEYPIYVKRDDLSGYGRQGIKIRKLETFLAYHLKKGYRNLIFIVPNISNLQNDLELIAQKENLKIVFIIANNPPLSKELRNNFIETSNVKHLLAGKSNLSVISKAIGTFIRLYFVEGEKYKIILPGASHPSSIIGSTNGIFECYEQFKSNNVTMPKKIFISASSGGSAAGLILGALILQREKAIKLKIHVTKVYPISLKYWIYFLLIWTKFKYKLEVNIKLSDVNIHQAYKDIAYGANKTFLKDKVEEIDSFYNLKVDHIYGAQSWIVMEKFLANQNQNLEAFLFWHCGFTINSHLFK